MNLESNFNIILPRAIAWAKLQEKLILSTGEPFSSPLLLDAQKIGIANPDKIRILKVDLIRRPDDLILRQACEQKDFLTSSTLGLTLGYGIFIKLDNATNYHLFLHELVHVSQYERFGSIDNFLKEYLYQILTIGYEASPLEHEAINKVKEIFGY